VPLSDHEQRLLEQMERALYQEDPKFASSLRSGRSGGIDRKKIALGVFGVALGLVTVVAGVALSQTIIGVLGFVLMIAGAFWAWLGSRGSTGQSGEGEEQGSPSAGPAPAPKAPREGQSSPFMSKMEERWRRRREGNGQF
jgi:hypothetical protein